MSPGAESLQEGGCVGMRVLCEWDRSGDRALALLHQSFAAVSLAPRAEIFIGVGSAVVRARGGGGGHPAELHGASRPARAESKHFLQGYLFWESSKNFWQPILVVQPLSCQNG